MRESTASLARSQARSFRLGRITFKPGPGASGAALVPVLTQDREGLTWTLSGLLRITPQDIGLRHWPTTRRERGRFIGRAIRAAKRALSGWSGR